MVEHVGIPRERLVQFRTKHLTEGVDFVREKNHVVLSHAGARTVMAALGLPPCEAERVLAAALPSAEKTPALVNLRVHPRRTMNPLVMLATDAKQQVVRVRVKQKDNFRAGMKIECRHLVGDLYEFTGNCPRFPGKF